MSSENGLLCRYDWIDPAVIAKWQEGVSPVPPGASAAMEE